MSFAIFLDGIVFINIVAASHGINSVSLNHALVWTNWLWFISLPDSIVIPYIL